MGSSYKTPYLNLNCFVGTDKPKMDDFNTDNKKIETAMKNHEENNKVHVTLEEKERWNSGVFTMGTYCGDGKAKREINIGFSPRLCIVFQPEMPLISCDTQTGANIRCGIVCEHGCTEFVTSTQNGFAIENMSTPSAFGATPKLNSNGQNYVYIAYK